VLDKFMKMLSANKSSSSSVAQLGRVESFSLSSFSYEGFVSSQYS
jgi:hypothetical protein